MKRKRKKEEDDEDDDDWDDDDEDDDDDDLDEDERRARQLLTSPAEAAVDRPPRRTGFTSANPRGSTGALPSASPILANSNCSFIGRGR